MISNCSQTASDSQRLVNCFQLWGKVGSTRTTIVALGYVCGRSGTGRSVWVAQLGYLLAAPGASEPARLPSPSGTVSLPGSLVSFLMHA